MKRCYTVTIKCGNCYEAVDIDIPQGTEVTEALKTKTCPYCGCTTEIRKNLKAKKEFECICDLN